MHIEDVKLGMKVKIIDSMVGCFLGLDGQVLTVIRTGRNYVYCEEFASWNGSIHVQHIEPVEEEKKMFTKSDLKDFMRVQYAYGRVRLYMRDRKSTRLNSSH